MRENKKLLVTRLSVIALTETAHVVSSLEKHQGKLQQGRRSAGLRE